MIIQLPDWAIRRATFDDHENLTDVTKRDFIRMVWPERKRLRMWAKNRGWKTPWFGFEKSFIAKMLEDKSFFEMATRETGIEIFVPVNDYLISDLRLREFDNLYNKRDRDGRPTSWDHLVGELREIRRAVEAGVLIKVDGMKLKTWDQFYSWAHDRYHALEDGCDSWIGDDN